MDLSHIFLSCIFLRMQTFVKIFSSKMNIAQNVHWVEQGAQNSLTAPCSCPFTHLCVLECCKKAGPVLPLGVPGNTHGLLELWDRAVPPQPLWPCRLLLSLWCGFHLQLGSPDIVGWVKLSCMQGGVLLHLAQRLAEMSENEEKTAGKVRWAKFSSLLEVTTEHGSE